MEPIVNKTSLSVLRAQYERESDSGLPADDELALCDEVERLYKENQMLKVDLMLERSRKVCQPIVMPHTREYAYEDPKPARVMGVVWGLLIVLLAVYAVIYVFN